MKTFKQQCKEYVEFTRTTASYPSGVALEYLVYGLADEAIEFYLEPLHSTNKLKELGDVMWYVARFCDELSGMDDPEMAAFTFQAVADKALGEALGNEEQSDVVLCEERMLKAAGQALGAMKRVYRGDYIRGNATMTSVLKNVVVSAMYFAKYHNKQQGLSTAERWLDVLRMNQEKLQSRLERGVIKGEGDER